MALPDRPVPLVYNPAAGGGRGEARFDDAQRLLNERGIEVEAVATEYPGHATELTHALAQGHDLIYIMGGDGTLSEAAEGILTSGKQPTLGCLPAGTGNDYLREFGVLDREAAVDRITMGRPRELDAATLTYDVDGDVRTRHWINVFGTGFAAQAAEITNRRFKWARSQAYNLGVLAKLLSLKPCPTKLSLDGEPLDGDYPMVMVCNSIHTGGAMQMAPMARPDDGLLDVLTVRGVSRLELIGLLAKVRDGGHVSHPKVHFHRAKRVEIAPERPSPLLVDGEILGTTPVDIQVLPGALRVLL